MLEVWIISNNKESLCHKKIPALIIRYIDEWVSTVRNVHHGGQCYQAYKHMHSTIIEQRWLIGAQINGILMVFFEEFMKTG